MQDSLQVFSEEMLQLIREEGLSSKQDLQKRKAQLARKHHLHQLPSNPTILSFAPAPSRALQKLLGKKPVKTLSGVAVIAVMVSAHPCPGKCIFCPSSLVGKATPKAYTGREPTTMRGLQWNFDPEFQALDRLQQFSACGHHTDKIELIVMGGTFLSQGEAYQDWFIRKALQGLCGTPFSSLEEAQAFAETSPHRLVGLTIETRPDWCEPYHINRMLRLGATRCELGVQVLDDAVYERIQRGHTVADVERATRELKDSAFKVCYHLMPGLPGSDPEMDVLQFKKVFGEPAFQPDMLKIYPCLVIENTPLYDEFKAGLFEPLSSEEAAEIIARGKQFIPPWVRVNRIQRDIPVPLISGGVKRSDLRELVKEKMQELGLSCRCIRCREAGLRSYKEEKQLSFSSLSLEVQEYEASRGKEFFLSFEDLNEDILFGFARLRFPSPSSFRPEISPDTALLRELRVFGEATPLHQELGAPQHRGLGAKLLGEAERIAGEAGYGKMTVIAGLGVKEYYRKKFGYQNDGPYVSKELPGGRK